MTQDTHRTPNENQPQSPIRAIRKKCLDCSGGSSNEVSCCTVTSCPLYAFRSGRNPYRKQRVMTEEQKQAAVARLAAAREKNNQQREEDEYDDL